MYEKLISFFPHKDIRPIQEEILATISKYIDEGYEYIVVEAPTGVGKSALGVSTCRWGSSVGSINFRSHTGVEEIKPTRQGYYLVTQKMLQDQIEKYGLNTVKSIKSSVEYACENYGNCGIGIIAKNPRCNDIKDGRCPYIIARSNFEAGPVGITNYAYILSEDQHVGNLKPRNVMVMDECHNLEHQLLNIAEVAISEKKCVDDSIIISDWPDRRSIDCFVDWMKFDYLPIVKDRLAFLESRLENCENESMLADTRRRINYYTNEVYKISYSVDGVTRNAKNWVYYTTENEIDGLTYILKPISVRDYSHRLFNKGAIKLFMSAFIGDKKLFCRSLGMNELDVAWIKVGSPFDISNRPINVSNLGSMSKKNQANTFPLVVKAMHEIASHHSSEKGIIHAHSYELCKKIVGELKGKIPHTIFSHTDADSRSKCYEDNRCHSGPSIVVSPSMTEGFDFVDDYARWQIIAKVPYPYLGDEYVRVKKDTISGWYENETVKTIVQASGRIVRSETDYGITYILDSDFSVLYSRFRNIFPKWYKDAVIFSSKNNKL